MSDFRPDPRLRGLSDDKFEKFGKPHVMAHYEGGSIDSHKLDAGAVCAFCGRPATNVHHHPGGRQTVEVAGTVLRPSLIAVCGSGTTGCHGRVQGGYPFDALWVWDHDRYAEEWRSGSFLADGFAPHDPRLYLFGCWELYDRHNGRIWRYRDGFEGMGLAEARISDAMRQRSEEVERIGWTGGLDE